MNTTTFLNYFMHENPVLSRAERDEIQLNRARRMAKRTRAEIACQPCKIKKARCSDVRPCNRCLNSKLPENCLKPDGYPANSGFSPQLAQHEESFPVSGSQVLWAFTGNDSAISSSDTQYSQLLTHQIPATYPSVMMDVPHLSGAHCTEQPTEYIPLARSPDSMPVVIAQQASIPVNISTQTLHNSFKRKQHSLDASYIEAAFVQPCSFVSLAPASSDLRVQTHLAHPDPAHLFDADDRAGCNNIPNARISIEGANCLGLAAADNWAWEAAPGPLGEDPFTEDWAPRPPSWRPRQRDGGEDRAAR